MSAAPYYILVSYNLHIPDILKVDLLRGQNFSLEILRKKNGKISLQNPLMCVKHDKKKL